MSTVYNENKEIVESRLINLSDGKLLDKVQDEKVDNGNKKLENKTQNSEGKVQDETYEGNLHEDETKKVQNENEIESIRDGNENNARVLMSTPIHDVEIISFDNVDISSIFEASYNNEGNDDIAYIFGEKPFDHFQITDYDVVAPYDDISYDIKLTGENANQ